MRTRFLGLLCVFLIVPFIGTAAVLRTGETVTVADDQVVADDFYAAGGTVSQSGRVEGDMYVAAASFTITDDSEITEDLTVFGGSVQIHASVTDDVRVVGGEVVISGPVGGDVVVIGGLLKILSSATIAGDVMFFGGDLQVLGDVGGSVLGTADTVRIDAHVEDSLDMTVGTLTLGDRAEVLGDVRYVSPTDLNRSQNAVVVGEVVRNTAPPVATPEYSNVLIMFIVLLFTALVLQLILRGALTRFTPELTDNLGLSGLIGFGAVILMPVIAAVTLVSVLGSFFGVIFIFIFILTLLLSIALAPVLMGALMCGYQTGVRTPHVLYTVISAALLQVAAFIPLVGPLLIMATILIVFGALIKVAFLTLRRFG
jgi:cytoskeletal protein CcmA (bactofilin family)